MSDSLAEGDLDEIKAGPASVPTSEPQWLSERRKHIGTLKVLLSHGSSLYSSISHLYDSYVVAMGQSSKSDVAQRDDLFQQFKTTYTQLQNNIGKMKHQFCEDDGRGIGKMVAAKMGVIGMEKAGKSAFLSGWIARRWNFLPSAESRCTGCPVHIFPTECKSLNDIEYEAMITLYTEEQLLVAINDMCETALVPTLYTLQSIKNATFKPIHTQDDGDGKKTDAQDGKNADNKNKITQTDREYILQRLELIQRNWDAVSLEMKSSSGTCRIREKNADIFSNKIRPYIDLSSPLSAIVKKACIYAPLPGVPAGVEVLDIPGVDCPGVSISRITSDMLPRLDLTLFLKDCHRPNMTPNEGDLLNAAIDVHGSDRVFVCISRIDEDLLNEPKSQPQIYRFETAYHDLKKQKNISKQRIHAITPYWHCTPADIPNNHSRTTTGMKKLVELGLRDNEHDSIDGMNRLVKHIDEWFRDLVERDAKQVRDSIIAPWNSMRDMALKLIQLAQPATEGTPIDTLFVKLCDGNGKTEIGILTALANAFNKKIEMHHIHPHQHDQNSTSADEKLEFIQIKDIHGQKRQINKYDWDDISRVVDGIQASFQPFINMTMVEQHLTTFIQTSHARPFTLEVFESSIRENAYRCTLEMPALRDQVSTSVNRALEFYQQEFLNATAYGGKLANIYPKKRELHDLLEKCKQIVRDQVCSKWEEECLPYLRLVIGIQENERTKPLLRELHESFSLPGCPHNNPGGFLSRKLIENKQGPKLFLLPWDDSELKEWNHIYYQDQKDFPSGKYTIPHTKPRKQIDIQKYICQTVRNRVMRAVSHLCEMIKHKLLMADCLHECRLSTSQLFHAQLMMVKEHYQIIQAILGAERVQVWPHHYQSQTHAQTLALAIEQANKCLQQTDIQYNKTNTTTTATPSQ